jgi:threonine/homoserine/homoserine lactone efflux protein
MFEIFGIGFIAGLALAIPMGPMAIMLLSTSLQRGWRQGAIGGFAMASVDFGYALVVALLGTSLATFFKDWSKPLTLTGAAILVLLGIQTVRRNLTISTVNAKSIGTSGGLAKTYVTFAAATVINPPTAIYFLSIAPSVGGSVAFGVSSLIFAFGVLLGSGIWQETLALLGHSMRRITSETVRTRIGVLGGILIVALAIYLASKALL